MTDDYIEGLKKKIRKSFKEKYFIKKADLDKEIEVKGFGVKQGLKLSNLDRQWWEHAIKKSGGNTKYKKVMFRTAWGDLVQKKLKSAKTGMDVPRGVDVERLFYKIGHGWTDNDYAKYLESYD